MTKDVIVNFQLLSKNMSSIVDASGYRNDFIAKKIGIAPTTFSVKKQRNSFTVEEIQRIIELIDNESVEEYYMLLMMRHFKDDESLSYQEAKKELGWS